MTPMRLRRHSTQLKVGCLVCLNPNSTDPSGFAPTDTGTITCGEVKVWALNSRRGARNAWGTIDVEFVNNGKCKYCIGAREKFTDTYKEPPPLSSPPQIPDVQTGSLGNWIPDSQGSFTGGLLSAPTHVPTPGLEAGTFNPRFRTFSGGGEAAGTITITCGGKTIGTVNFFSKHLHTHLGAAILTGSGGQNNHLNLAAPWLKDRGSKPHYYRRTSTHRRNSANFMMR